MQVRIQTNKTPCTTWTVVQENRAWKPHGQECRDDLYMQKEGPLKQTWKLEATSPSLTTDCISQTRMVALTCPPYSHTTSFLKTYLYPLWLLWIPSSATLLNNPLILRKDNVLLPFTAYYTYAAACVFGSQDELHQQLCIPWWSNLCILLSKGRVFRLLSKQTVHHPVQRPSARRCTSWKLAGMLINAHFVYGPIVWYSLLYILCCPIHLYVECEHCLCGQFCGDWWCCVVRQWH